MLYATTASGDLFALGSLTTNATLLWRLNGTHSANFSGSVPALAADGTIWLPVTYFSALPCGSSCDTAVVAVWPQDGTIRCQTTGLVGRLTSPVISPDGVVVVGSATGVVTAINGSTCASLASYALDSAIAFTPVVIGVNQVSASLRVLVATSTTLYRLQGTFNTSDSNVPLVFMTRWNTSLPARRQVTGSITMGMMPASTRGHSALHYCISCSS